MSRSPLHIGIILSPCRPIAFTTHQSVGFVVKRYAFLKDFNIINSSLYIVFTSCRLLITSATLFKTFTLPLAFMYRFTVNLVICFKSRLYRPLFLSGVCPSNPLSLVMARCSGSFTVSLASIVNSIITFLFVSFSPH